MNKYFFLYIFAFISFLSCNNDDENVNQENNNGFFIDSDFIGVNRAYYSPDVTTDDLDDFIIIVTDGEIISFSNDSIEYEFSDTTTSSVIFRGIQNPNTPTALNFAPSGSYIFNSNNETFSFANFNFNCEASNGNLQVCQYSEIIEESTIPNIAIIDIERDDSTAKYIINYNFELPNSVIINGHFSGNLDRFESE